MSKRIRVTCDVAFDAQQQARLVKEIPDAAFTFIPSAEPDDSPIAAQPETLRDTDVLVSHWPPLGNEPSLQWVQVDSSGVDYLRDQAGRLAATNLTNAAGVYAPQIAQYVLGNLLSISERHLERRRLQEQQRWQTMGEDHARLTGDPLRGRTIAIVGYGGSGREIARLTAAVGMRVVAVTREGQRTFQRSYALPGTGDPDGSIPEAIHRLADLERVVAMADVVVLSLPLTAETRGIFDASALASISPHAWIVNVGRGALIDTDALVRRLELGRLGGAILDVVDPEPLPPTSPLWGLPNVVITPHVAGGAEWGRALFLELLIANLHRYLAGQPLMNLVDIARGY